MLLLATARMLVYKLLFCRYMILSDYKALPIREVLSVGQHFSDKAVNNSIIYKPKAHKWSY